MESAAPLYSLAALAQLIQSHPDRWRPLVFTNGCFDLLHAGHVRYLTAARSLGRTLVVGLNSDASVKMLKGDQRPIVPEAQRAEVLQSLKAVDGVIIFGEKTADRVIAQLQPDIYAKGGDYRADTLPEAETVRSIGGTISLIQVEIPCSSSQIIQRILDVYA